MSSTSSPSLPLRKYGSLGHDDDDIGNKAHLLPGAPDRVLSFNLSGDGEVEGQGSQGGIRWYRLAVVSTLAVGVMLGLTRAGYRLPSPTKSDIASASRGESMIQANEVLTANGSTVRGGQGYISKFTSGPAVTADSLEPLSFTALNFYHVRDGKPAQDYPWLKEVKLIEPHRETTLAVEAPRKGYEYRWEVRGGDPEKAELRATASGPETVVTLTVLDDNVIVLEEVDPETKTVTRRLSERVMVKYVRREIRTLTDEEREELFDAMYTLWTVRVDGGKGKELYGEDYADIYAINRLHFKAASDSDCDHFHDGLGFLINHSLISNTFEYSLQKVNPKLTLPYWDFTIDGSSAGGVLGNAVSSAQEVSEIFSSTWFGSADPEDNMLKDSRWGYTEIPLMYQDDPGNITPDVYGKLRAPWNVNDRAYLTRGMGNMCGFDSSFMYAWPTCETHYEMATDYSDFYSWVWKSLYDPHGPVHIWIGGVLDCEESYAKIADLAGTDAAEDLAMFSFFHRKNLYRDGYFKCEGTADVSESPHELFESGQCGCLDFDLTQGDDYETIYPYIYGLDAHVGDAPADIKRQVVAIICDAANDGDHLQASSSLDPSFWPTHPTMERLWMYSILTGHVTDFTWPDEDISYTDKDGSTVTESLSLYGEGCTGHAGSDVFPFGLLVSDVDGFTVKTGIRGNMETGNTLTNREVLQAFDARSNSLPYVYDTFKWTHCEADGVYFDDAWVSGKAGKKSTRARPSFKEGEPRIPRYSGIEKMREEARARRARAHGQA